ncbi:MAG: SRPBCC domain-containing protein [Chitinophagaceae bacterium]|nr:SRPBCC domain-containing protein [Chitinophagaceae bacterium]
MIIAQTTLQVPLEKAWEKWTNPADIMAWNYANSDWHCPRAANDLRAGAKFNYRMEAKDGSFGFDFEGTYSNITPHELIDYSLADGRKVTIEFKAGGDQTEVIQKFEPETVNPFDSQRDGWQAIMNNYKVHAEK